MMRESTMPLERAQATRKYKSMTHNAMVNYWRAFFKKMYGIAFRIGRVQYVGFLFLLLIFSLAYGQLEARVSQPGAVRASRKLLPHPGKLPKLPSKSILNKTIHEAPGYSLHQLDKIGAGARKTAYSLPDIDHSVLLMLNGAPNFRGTADTARQLLNEQLDPLRRLRKVGVPTPRFGRGVWVANSDDLVMAGGPTVIPMQQMERVSMTLSDAVMDIRKLRMLAPYQRHLKIQLAEILRRMDRAKMVADDLHGNNIGIIFRDRTPHLAVIDPVIFNFHESLKALQGALGDWTFKRKSSSIFFTDPHMRRKWEAASTFE